MFFTCGFIFPMSMGKGLSLFRHIAGTATAMMYFINVMITSLASLLVSFIQVKNFISIIIVYLLLIIGCAFIYWCILHKNKKFYVSSC
jgi:MFS transporter, DHA1 family, multidrug resistance protein